MIYNTDDEYISCLSSDSEDEEELSGYYRRINTLLLSTDYPTNFTRRIENANDIESIVLVEKLLYKLPFKLCLLPNVKVLNVSRSKLTELPDVVGCLQNLEILDASDNDLEMLPDCLQLASNLMVLNVANNKIKDLPEEYVDLRNLTEVNLSCNELTYVPYAITYGSERISSLDLSHNYIEYFSNEPNCSDSLKILKLNDNKIGYFPDWMEHLYSIEVLYLGKNPFRMVSSLSRDEMFPVVLSSMKKLSMPSCGLIHLPASLKNMPNLRYLEAGNDELQFDKLCNAIWDMDSVLTLKHLRELRLAYVSLCDIADDFWENLSHLEILDLRGNRLLLIPGGISNLSNLTRCILSSNLIELLPNDIGYLESLKHLSLNGNRLTKLPETLENLENLEYLDLYDNEITEFPAVISRIPNLRYVDMEKNLFCSDLPPDDISEDFKEKYLSMKKKLKSLQKISRLEGPKMYY